MTVLLGRVRGKAQDMSARAAAHRALSGMRVDVPGRAASVLLLRELSDPLPGALLTSNQRLNPGWQNALQNRLNREYVTAHRPRAGHIDGNANAILFADEAELLTCLLKSMSRHPGGPCPWWWRGAAMLLQRPENDRSSLLMARPQLVPAVCAALDDHAALDTLQGAPLPLLLMMARTVLAAFAWPGSAVATALAACGLETSTSSEVPTATEARTEQTSKTSTAAMSEVTAVSDQITAVAPHVKRAIERRLLTLFRRLAYSPTPAADMTPDGLRETLDRGRPERAIDAAASETARPSAEMDFSAAYGAPPAAMRTEQPSNGLRNERESGASVSEDSTFPEARVREVAETGVLRICPDPARRSFPRSGRTSVTDCFRNTLRRDFLFAQCPSFATGRGALGKTGGAGAEAAARRRER